MFVFRLILYYLFVYRHDTNAQACGSNHTQSLIAEISLSGRLSRAERFFDRILLYENELPSFNTPQSLSTVSISAEQYTLDAMRMTITYLEIQ